MNIQTIRANSKDGGEVYRLLSMAHSMAGMLANSPDKHFRLAMCSSDPMYGPVMTVWTNGIICLEARTYKDEEPNYHEYSMYAVSKELSE